MSHEALLDAIRAGRGEEALALLDGDASLCVADDVPSALLTALYHRQAAVAAAIAARRRDLTIFEAAAVGHEAAVRAALEATPRLRVALAEDGFTALHLACFFGHEAVVEALLWNGAPVDAIAANASGVRPMHSAAAAGSVAICTMLIDADADVDSVQQGGYTALHSAAAAGNVALAQMLVARGADPHLAADDGRTPITMAREAGHIDLAQELEHI